MSRFSTTTGIRVGVATAALVAGVGLTAAPASADEINSVPPNKIEQTYYTCTGGGEVTTVATGLQWPDPETWQAYTHSTETTSADGSINTRMDHYRGVNTYVKSYQCYNGFDRYILSPETGLTKTYTITRAYSDGGVAVLYSGWSGWH